MESVKIQDALKMRSGINIEKAIVTNKGDPRTVNLKSGGSVDVCDCTIEDDTGKMQLTLWGGDIQLVTEGCKVSIENGYTNEFKGNVSLTKGKFGTLTVLN